VLVQKEFIFQDLKAAAKIPYAFRSHGVLGHDPAHAPQDFAAFLQGNLGHEELLPLELKVGIEVRPARGEDFGQARKGDDFPYRPVLHLAVIQSQEGAVVIVAVDNARFFVHYHQAQGQFGQKGLIEVDKVLPGGQFLFAGWR